MKWVNDLRTWRWFKWLLGGTLSFIILLLVISIAWGMRPLSPLVSAAHHTHKLHQEMIQLKTELGSNRSSNDAHRRYVSLLSSIKQSCMDISRDSERARDDTDTTKQQRQAIRSTVEVCNDLKILVEASIARAEALASLATIDTTVRRYQTFPPLTQNIRRDDLAALNKVEQTLRTIKSDSEFPFSISSQLSSLETSMKESKNLDYRQTLEAFQTELKAERQRYWASYVSISDLIRELEVQTQRYCGYETVEKQLPTCKG